MRLAQAFARFVVDLDGVVWRGSEPIAGSPETLRRLREAGKRVCFVTNNSTATPEDYARKLDKVGAGGDEREVVTSALAAAELLRKTVPGLRGRLTYVIGGEGLRSAVEATGARVVDDEEGAEATLVVVGLDRGLTYEKLRRATLAIRSGATFVASNVDPTYPSEDGLVPGAGSIVAALRATTGVEPLVAGKPQREILELARERLGGAPALVIGDRVDTDVMAGIAMGWPTALVLTGTANLGELATAPAWPDFVLRRLSDVLEDLPHPKVRRATGPDLPHVARLLHDGGLPAGGARERVGRTLVAEVERKVIATAAWDPVGPAALVRSVAVDPALRSSGVGTLVTAAAVRAAAEAGVREAYLVTPDAEPFFARLGFVRVEGDGLPEEVRAHSQVTRECVGAPVMRLAIAPPVATR